MLLYRGLARPHQENAVQFWSPFLRKVIDLIEKVQHRATKMINGLSGMDYGNRLRSLNMYSLENRRTRGDLIQLFKFINKGDMEGLGLNLDSRTRGHELKLIKSGFKKEVRKNYFYERVINVWNGLPDYVVYSKRVEEFKRNLDSHWRLVNN